MNEWIRIYLLWKSEQKTHREKERTFFFERLLTLKLGWTPMKSERSVLYKYRDRSAQHFVMCNYPENDKACSYNIIATMFLSFNIFVIHIISIGFILYSYPKTYKYNFLGNKKSNLRSVLAESLPQHLNIFLLYILNLK